MEFLRKTKSDLINFSSALKTLSEKSAKTNIGTPSTEISKLKDEEIKLMKALANHVIFSTLFQFEILKYIEQNENNKNNKNPVLCKEITNDISEQLYRLNVWYNKWIKNP